MKDIQKLVRIQLFATLVFIITKAIRSNILERNPPVFIKITFLSLPNFFEGFIGSITLTGIFLFVNYTWISKDKRLQNKTLYRIAIIISTVYVITQEFKIHNLGGKNIYDPYDVLFSIIGLALGYRLIQKWQPTMNKSARD